MELLVPLAILGLMWALLIRPQQRRVREHQAYVAGVQVGDEVITTSGLFGTVTAIDDQRARLLVAPGVEVTVARQAIGRPQPTAPASPATPADPPATDDPEQP